MTRRWFTKPGFFLMAVALLLAGLAVAPPSAQAQSAEDVAATCGDLAVLGIPEGPRAIEAAESLRARGAPNPPGIESAIDVVVAFADLTSSTRPELSEVDAALATLNTYFGGACAGLDRCQFVTVIGGTDAAAAAQAAHVLRRIETPAPPGIDAALALIAGDISESPFHSNVEEARAQVLSYYPCGDTGDTGGGDGAGDGGDTGGDGDTGGGLALTGVSSAPLAALGFALVTSGAGLMRTRRRFGANNGE